MATASIFKFVFRNHLLRLFDKRDVYIKNLLEQGFDDVFYIDRYYDSFARTEDELLLSKKIRSEITSRYFWDECIASSRSSMVGVSLPPYHGNWLDQLAEQQKNLLLPGGELTQAENFSNSDLDPCALRRKTIGEWRYANIDLINNILLRRDELATTGIIPIVAVADEVTAIGNYIAECVIFSFSDISFKRIKPKDPQKIIFAKRLNDDLELRFEVSSKKWSFSQFQTGYYGSAQDAYSQPNWFRLSLGLHSRSMQTKLFHDVPEVVIPFTHLIPFPRMEKYRNAAHIAVAIAGWISLYRMVATDVEQACLKCWLNNKPTDK